MLQEEEDAEEDAERSMPLLYNRPVPWPMPSGESSSSHVYQPASRSSAAGSSTGAAAAASSAAAAAQAPPPRPPKVCAVPGCGGTSGLKRCIACKAVHYCNKEWRTGGSTRRHAAACRRSVRLRRETCERCQNSGAAELVGTHACRGLLMRLLALLAWLT